MHLYLPRFYVHRAKMLSVCHNTNLKFSNFAHKIGWYNIKCRNLSFSVYKQYESSHQMVVVQTKAREQSKRKLCEINFLPFLLLHFTLSLSDSLAIVLLVIFLTTPRFPGICCVQLRFVQMNSKCMAWKVNRAPGVLFYLQMETQFADFLSIHIHRHTDLQPFKCAVIPVQTIIIKCSMNMNYAHCAHITTARFERHSSKIEILV